MFSHRIMHLGAFLPGPGHHVAAWRHRETPENSGLNFRHYLDMARTAERGCFDMIFLSDGVGVRNAYANEDELSRWGRTVHFEPITLLSALAATTENIGLTATASTTYNEPFHIARKFASLDFLSSGRAGWNVVTSVTDLEAQNFNLDRQPDHAARYLRAHEFMEVVTTLWDSWDDDAFLIDKEKGRYFDPSKLHIARHKGEHFSVKGPLNIARPPQGYPVIIQAGSSDDGKGFASKWAEVIFTAHQTLDQARHFYSEMKERVTLQGREPDDIRILPGVFPVIGRTISEAEEKYEELQSLIDPIVGMGLLAAQLGDIDLSKFDLDGPFPTLPPTRGSTSRQQLLVEQARRENLTLRDLMKKVAGSRGHWLLIGTPSSIADELQNWFENGGADGFNVLPPRLPASLNDFVDLVVPELRRRNLVRTQYLGSTLRDHLCLRRPTNQHFKTSY